MIKLPMKAVEYTGLHRQFFYDDRAGIREL